jgi:uncharacterized protein (TIGR03067 family)
MVEWLLSLALASSGMAVAPEPCESIEGIRPLLKPGKVLLLGELHGTMESPAFALDAACHAARSGLPVIMGVELMPADQGRVDRFLDSEGTDEDRRSLLAGAQWQSSYQDGRASLAMFDLIEGLRKLRREGLDVSVALFDASGAKGGQQRDRDMARNLASFVIESPRSMMIVLTGNYHSRTTTGVPWDSEYEPMGYVLGRATSFDNLTALNVAHGDGSAWICGPDCGIVDLSGRHGEARWTIEIDDATRPPGHAGWYHVGSITASPPAKSPPSELQSRADEPAKKVEAPCPDTKMTRPRSPGSEVDANRPLSDPEAKLQGPWQAYDFASQSKTWAFRFDGRGFLAQGGTDDWYEGRITVRADEQPAQIDFAIDDCMCSYKGMTSEGIYRWDGNDLVVSAPRPGDTRPRRFVRSSGQMMRLVPSRGQ